MKTPQTPLLLRLGLELVVIFVGVTAAFALSEYESRRDDAERRHQLQAALVQEIRDVTSNTRRVAEYLPGEMARFDSAVAAGGQPPLQPWTEPVRLQTHMWQVTLDSGALDLFDVSTVYDLSQFYNELNMGFDQIEQLRELSQTLLIPNLGENIDEFYDRETNELRPKYRWHPDGLRRLSMLATRITALGDSLVGSLESE